MSSDMIDYLMGQPDGANYVVLYQMLCLKTINTGGRLAFQIGDMIIPYDVEKIQRECKWFSLATVRVALEVYKQIGLIYEDKDGVLVLANYSDIVGSETDYSAQKRLQRENRRRQLPPKCADSNEDNNVDNVHTEKEIEIDKEKDIENRERVRDNGSPTVDAGLAEIIRSFEDNPRTWQDWQGICCRYADHQRACWRTARGDCLHCDGQGRYQGHQRDRHERRCHRNLREVYRVR